MPSNYTPVTTSTPVIRASAAPTQTPVTPASTQVGDLIIAITGIWGPSVEPVTVNTAEGWNHFMVREGSNGLVLGDNWLLIAWKIATVAGSVSIQPYNTVTSANKWTGVVVFEAGTAANPIAGSVVASGDDGGSSGFDWAFTAASGSAAPDAPSVTTPTTNCLVFAIGAWELSTATDVSVTPPSGYTEVWEVSGTQNVELSLASKAVATVGAENPGVFADNVAPVATMAATFIVRPSGYHTTIDVPKRGDKRTAAICQPPWKHTTDNDQWMFDRKPEVLSYTGTGNPLWNAPTNGSAGLTDTVSAYVEKALCTVGDKILVDMTLDCAILPDGGVALEWASGIWASDSHTSSPVTGFVDGCRWDSVTTASPPWDTDKLSKRMIVRIIGVHTVKKAGTTRLSFSHQSFSGSGSVSFRIYGMSVTATRFPVGGPSALPILNSINFNLADTAGGDSLTITGENLASSTVKVGGTTATVTGTTSTTVTFTMPVKAAGFYDVEVTNAVGTSGGIEVEAWSPLQASNVSVLLERTSYSESGGNGTWTARFGSNWSHATAAPPASGGAPDFNGSSNFLLGPNFSLFDSGNPGRGTFGCVVQADTAATQDSLQRSNRDPAIFSDTAEGRVGLAYSDRSVSGGGPGVEAFITTTAGVGDVRVTMGTGAYHSVLWKYDGYGAGSTSTLSVQVDGKDDSGDLGWESTELPGVPTDILWPTSNIFAMGKNFNAAAFFDGKVRAAFFTQHVVSDSFAEKFVRWARVRHGVT